MRKLKSGHGRLKLVRRYLSHMYIVGDIFTDVYALADFLIGLVKLWLGRLECLRHHLKMIMKNLMIDLHSLVMIFCRASAGELGIIHYSHKSQNRFN